MRLNVAKAPRRRNPVSAGNRLEDGAAAVQGVGERGDIQHAIRRHYLMRHNAIVVGSPAHVAEQISRFRDTLGCRHYTIYMALAGMDYRKMMRSIELFAERVMPALAAAEPEVASA